MTSHSTAEAPSYKPHTLLLQLCVCVSLPQPSKAKQSQSWVGSLKQEDASSSIRMLQLQPSCKTSSFAIRLLAVRDSDACMCVVLIISRCSVATPASDTLFMGACATAASASTYRNVASCSSASMGVHKQGCDWSFFLSFAFVFLFYGIYSCQHSTPSYSKGPRGTRRSGMLGWVCFLHRHINKRAWSTLYKYQ